MPELTRDNYDEHIEVLKTIYDAGLITRQAMKSICGQVLRMPTASEREAYLKKVIANCGKRLGKGAIDHARQETISVASN